MAVGDSLRAFVKAAKDFMAFAIETWNFGKFIWNGENPDHQAQADAFIKIMWDNRQNAVVEGTHAGVSLVNMRGIIQSCLDAAKHSKGWEQQKSGSPQSHVASAFADPLGTLEDIIAAIDKEDENEQPKNKTTKAVFLIIKAQPKGKGISGKGIVLELKKAGIVIDSGTLRRHHLKELKDHFGVINHKAAGGYKLK